MRLTKLTTVVAIGLSVAAFAATPAMAEIEFLPGNVGTTYLIEIGEAKLKSAAGTVVCKGASLGVGKFKSKTEHAIEIKFKQCTFVGLEARGLADPEKSKQITATATVKTCTVSTAPNPLVGALLVKFNSVHVEVPAAKLLLLFEGDVIALLSPTNALVPEFGLTLNEAGGKQEDRTCKDGVTGRALTENLIVKDDGVEMGEAVVVLSNAKLREFKNGLAEEEQVFMT